MTVNDLLYDPESESVPLRFVAFEGIEEERLLKANAVMHDVVWKNQKPMRFIVARLLDQSNGSREMSRQKLRTDFIHTALAPARDRFDAATYRKQSAAVALVIGAESMFVFYDVLQIEEAEVRKVENWVVRVLTRAALLESRAKDRKASGSTSPPRAERRGEWVGRAINASRGRAGAREGSAQYSRFSR